MAEPKMVTEHCDECGNPFDILDTDAAELSHKEGTVICPRCENIGDEEGDERDEVLDDDQRNDPDAEVNDDK